MFFALLGCLLPAYVLFKYTRMDSAAITRNIPIILFSFYFIIYYGFGTMGLMWNETFLMVPPSELLPYTLFIALLSYLACIKGFDSIAPRGDLQCRQNFSGASQLAILIGYCGGWGFRFVLISLGLYQKYAYLENFQNTEVSELVNIFIQFQGVMVVFATASTVMFTRYKWALIVIEIANSFIIGAKSGIVFMIFIPLIFNYAYLSRLLVKPRLSHSIYAVFIAALLWISGYITPYAQTFNIVSSANYVTELIFNLPDFLEFVATSGSSEYGDEKYIRTRYAALDPAAAIVYRHINNDVPLTCGVPPLQALEMMIPRVLYKDKPEYFGEDIEEQGALRHFNLPDGDVCGSILMSGYASFGAPGALVFMFAYGAFLSFFWNALRRATRGGPLASSCACMGITFYLWNFVKIEHTFITATVLNVRNLAFLLVIYAMLFFMARAVIAIVPKWSPPRHKLPQADAA